MEDEYGDSDYTYAKPPKAPKLGRSSKRNVPQNYGYSNKIVYWIMGYTVNKNSKSDSVIVGWYPTEDSAVEYSIEKFGTDNYRIFPLHTIDRTRACKMIRKIIFDETNSIDEAFRRFRHDKRRIEE